MVSMNTRAFATGAAFCLALAGSAALAAPKDPSGTYLTEDGRARVRVEKCGPQLTNMCGYVVWMKLPTTETGEAKTDKRNPDKAKNARLLLGHQLMMGLAPYKDESYTGKIYNNEDGKSYDVTIYPDKTDLKVKGCLIAFLCKTQTWTRAEDEGLPGQLLGGTNTPTGPQADLEWKTILPDSGGAGSKPAAAGAKPAVAGAKPVAASAGKAPAAAATKAKPAATPVPTDAPDAPGEDE